MRLSAIRVVLFFAACCTGAAPDVVPPDCVKPAPWKVSGIRKPGAIWLRSTEVGYRRGSVSRFWSGSTTSTQMVFIVQAVDSLFQICSRVPSLH